MLERSTWKLVSCVLRRGRGSDTNPLSDTTEIEANTDITTTLVDQEKTIARDVPLASVSLATDFFIGVWVHQEVEEKRRTKDGRDCFEIVCSRKDQFDYIKPLLISEHVKIIAEGEYNKSWRLKVEPTEKAKMILDIIDMMIEGNTSVTTIEQGKTYLKLYRYIYENKDRDENEHSRSISISPNTTWNFGVSAGEKNAAANDLAKVLFEGADPNILNGHTKALGQGELHRIYERAKKAFPSIFPNNSSSLFSSISKLLTNKTG